MTMSPENCQLDQLRALDYGGVPFKIERHMQKSWFHLYYGHWASKHQASMGSCKNDSRESVGLFNNMGSRQAALLDCDCSASLQNFLLTALRGLEFMTACVWGGAGAGAGLPACLPTCLPACLPVYMRTLVS